jgi:hypothetical protein
LLGSNKFQLSKSGGSDLPAAKESPFLLLSSWRILGISIDIVTKGFPQGNGGITSEEVDHLSAKVRLCWLSQEVCQNV